MTPNLILPAQAQIEWMQCGIGIIIHLDVQVFEPDYLFRKKWGYLNVENPGLVRTGDSEGQADYNRIVEMHLTLQLLDGLCPTVLLISEDIAQGERVRRFVVEAHIDGQWIQIREGSNIGQHRIERFAPILANALRLTILGDVATPQLTQFSALEVDAALLHYPDPLRDASTC